jgi:hypothetical protein
MKNINGLLESNCVDRPVCIPSVVLHDFKNAWSFASPGFGARVLASELRHAQSCSKLVLNRAREGQQGRPCWTPPKITVSLPGLSSVSSWYYPILGYSVKSVVMPKVIKVIRKVLRKAQYLSGRMLEKQVRTAGALLCQNCVKTLSVFVVGVSFRAKSRCPKLL